MKRSLPASLLALAAALALAGCTTYTGTPAAPPASETVPTEPGWEPTPFDCATLATEGDKPEQLPEGAARITLCDEPGHEIRQTTPPDALVSDTAAVVAAYNTQEHANLAVMLGREACLRRSRVTWDEMIKDFNARVASGS